MPHRIGEVFFCHEFLNVLLRIRAITHGAADRADKSAVQFTDYRAAVIAGRRFIFALSFSFYFGVFVWRASASIRWFFLFAHSDPWLLSTIVNYESRLVKYFLHFARRHHRLI